VFHSSSCRAFGERRRMKRRRLQETAARPRVLARPDPIKRSKRCGGRSPRAACTAAERLGAEKATAFDNDRSLDPRTAFALCTSTIKQRDEA
jgi:hypothetical protein